MLKLCKQKLQFTYLFWLMVYSDEELKDITPFWGQDVRNIENKVAELCGWVQIHPVIIC